MLCSTCRPSNFCLFLCVITFPKQLTCKITVKGAFRLNVQRDYFCIKRCQLLTTSEIVNIREHKMPSRRFFKVNSCKKILLLRTCRCILPAGIHAGPCAICTNCCYVTDCCWRSWTWQQTGSFFNNRIGTLLIFLTWTLIRVVIEKHSFDINRLEVEGIQTAVGKRVIVLEIVLLLFISFEK